MSGYHAWTHRPKAQGGTDPIEFPASTDPWAMITDGGLIADSGVAYPVGGQYFGTNDVDEVYYNFNANNTTYPSIGSYDYYTLEVVQRGIYLIDAMMALESWATVTNGHVYFSLAPFPEAWYPFGFGTNENDGWIDHHVTHDPTNGQVGNVFRVGGIASLDAGTEFFPQFRQTTGVNALAAAFNYLKVIRLQEYEAIANLRTGDLV